MFEIGDKVETVYGIGVVEWTTVYSVGRYYDVRCDDGSLVKVFHNELQAA